jgi:hypothetical protein
MAVLGLDAATDAEGAAMIATVAATLPVGIYDLTERNKRALATIEDYATGHALMDVGIGLAGFLPIPGAAPASIFAALLAQIPVYMSLAHELRTIYPALPGTLPVGRIGLYVAADTTMTVGADIATQFGMEFLNEIRSQIFQEVGLGFAASWIPVIGGIVSTAVDFFIAYTMTRRVGWMISAYYQNAENWALPRPQMYRRAAENIGKEGTANGSDYINNIPNVVPEVDETQVRLITIYVESLREANPSITDEKLLEMLRKMLCRKPQGKLSPT